ncbi:MAG: hypothetical protein IK086_04345, partial [Clostridia bacterium]|nr:hypothetical protein [Clostridia bacterium]
LFSGLVDKRVVVTFDSNSDFFFHCHVKIRLLNYLAQAVFTVRPRLDWLAGKTYTVPCVSLRHNINTGNCWGYQPIPEQRIAPPRHTRFASIEDASNYFRPVLNRTYSAEISRLRVGHLPHQRM